MRRLIVLSILAFLLHDAKAQSVHLEVEQINYLKSTYHQWYNLGDSSLEVFSFASQNDTLKIYQPLNKIHNYSKGRFYYTVYGSYTYGNFDRSLIKQRPKSDVSSYYQLFELPSSIRNIDDNLPFKFQYLGLYDTVSKRDPQTHQLYAQYVYQYGVPHGRCLELSYQIHQEKNFHLGVPHGTWVTKMGNAQSNMYFNQGQEVFIEHYTNDSLDLSVLHSKHWIYYNKAEIERLVFPVDRWWYRIIKFYPNHQLEYEGYGNARYNFDSIRTWHWYDTAGKLIKTKHFDEFAPIYQEEIGMLEELDQFQIYTELHLSPTLIDQLKNIEFKKKQRGTILCKVTFNSEGKIQSVVPQHIDKNLESQYDLISAVIQKSTLVPYSYRDVAYSGELLMRIVIAN